MKLDVSHNFTKTSKNGFKLFCKILFVNLSKDVDYTEKTNNIYIYFWEVNSQTKYEFYIFIETLQIVSSMCSLQMAIMIYI